LATAATTDADAFVESNEPLSIYNVFIFFIAIAWDRL